jgi:hypothetical protein
MFTKSQCNDKYSYIGIQGMLNDLNFIYADFESVGNNIECAPIQSLWFKFINQGIYL